MIGTTLAVPYEVLRTAKRRWDDAADGLDGSWRRLSRASTEGFSSEVAAAVDAFRDPWVDEIKACASQAQGHSDDVVLFHHLVLLTDQAQAEQVRSTLPWAWHDAEIG